MKKLIAIFLFVFLISLVNAQPPFEETLITEGYQITLNQQSHVSVGQNYTLYLHVFNETTGVLIDNSSTNCTLHWYSPDGSSVTHFDFNFDAAEDEFYFYIDNGNFTTEGAYPWVITCQSPEAGGFIEGLVTITSIGEELTQAQSILYVGLLAILIFVFIGVLVGINFLPSSNTKDEEGRILSISYMKYLRNILYMFEWMMFVAILYISSNLAFAYLGGELIAQVFFVLFQITFGLTPLIVTVWVIMIFVNMYHDKKFQQLLNRGFFPQGNL